jgi:hypothetical protein
MGYYATQTTVPVERSNGEIERTLTRFGATAFGSIQDEHKAAIMFQARGRKIRFILPLPEPKEFQRTPSGRARHGRNAIQEAYQQEIKRRWRALCLVIKAKLEAVESGITEFESEFLAHIMLPNGKTVGEQTIPMVSLAYETGRVSPIMLEFTGSK